MRVLHVVKTADGAVWAAKLAARLTVLGVEVHVALPRLEGGAISYWERSGAILHAGNLDFPVRYPQRLPQVLRNVRRLVARVSPDLIHSHFVGTTLALRLALGKHHSLPRIFQVPGPLHLEHSFYRRLELSSSGPQDYWIASSRCVQNHYLRAGVAPGRVFLSYYGDGLTPVEEPHAGISLRARVGAQPNEILVGSISWMYPPKWYLGQRIGLKAHEDLIRALGLVCRRDARIRGVISGSVWGGAGAYEQRLRKLARRAAGDRIIFTGAMPFAEARHAWRGLDLAVHVPISENCGGVIEPLLAGVPVIASEVGGLPEVIHDGLTGMLVKPRDPEHLAEAIESGIRHLDDLQKMAQRGQCLVRGMFDGERTAQEVAGVYRHILDGEPRPAEFDARLAVQALATEYPADSQAGVRRHKPQAAKEFVSCPH